MQTNDNGNIHIPKRHRSVGIYPGQDIRQDVEILIKVLKGKGTSLSAQLRPALVTLIADHRKAIDGHVGI